MADGISKVLVTGFGPFSSNKINSSWEVAKELSKMGLESRGINLVIEEIPVCYNTVAKELPKLWEELAPQLVIHMGLSASSSEIKLESTAHRRGYCKPDNDGNCPLGGTCNGIDDVLCTQLDLVDVIGKIKRLEDNPVPVVLSADAGRYVCEFTYYTSLNCNNYRTVFVHVPDIDKPFSVKEMAGCVRHIILFLLEEIKNNGSGESKTKDDAPETSSSKKNDNINLINE